MIAGMNYPPPSSAKPWDAEGLGLRQLETYSYALSGLPIPKTLYPSFNYESRIREYIIYDLKSTEWPDMSVRSETLPAVYSTHAVLFH